MAKSKGGGVASPDPSSWDHGVETLDGIRLRARRDAERFVPGVVTVFLHGIVSSPRAWLAPIPPKRSGTTQPTTAVELVASSIRMVTDVLLYRYPSNPLVRGSTTTAASGLASAIRAAISKEVGFGPEPKHFEPTRVVFVAHSNGGLVLKRALLEAVGGLRGPAERAPAADAVPDLPDRTQYVLNLAVPHFGGKATLAPAAGIATLFSAIAGNALRLVRAFVPPLEGCGFNSIVWDLARPQGRLPFQSTPTLANLETSWLRQREHLRKQSRWSGIETDFAFSNDVATAGALETREGTGGRYGRLRAAGERKVYVGLGGHPIQRMDWDSIRHWVGRDTSGLWKRHASRQLARVAAALSREMERNLGVDTMMGSPSGANGDQQVDAVRRLLEAVHADRPGPRRAILLHGEANVGKTRVAARVMRTLCEESIGQPASLPHRAVILMQLHNVHLEPVELSTIRGASASEPSPARDALIQAWARTWHGKLGVPPEFLRRWVAEATLEDSTVFLLDGVDNLLRTHPELRLSQLLGPWAQLATDPAADARPRVVGAVRAGFPGISELQDPDSGWEPVKVGAVDDAYAKQHYPKAVAAIEAIQRERFAGWESVVATAMSPMFLPLLEREAAPAADANVVADPLTARATGPCDSVTELVRRCARSRLRSPIEFPEDHPMPTPVAELALASIARGFYGASATPELPVAEIRDGSTERLRQLAERGHRLASEAAALVSDGKRLTSVLSRFLTSGAQPDAPDKTPWSFLHETWRNFFVGAWYAEVVRAGWVDEIGAVAYVPDVTTHAGRLLQVSIQRDLVEKCAARTLTSGDVFFLANIHALYSWIPGLQTDAGARQAQIDAMRRTETPAFCRFFIMNGLGSSAIRVASVACAEGRPADVGPWKSLAQGLADIVAGDGYDPISRSQAWMYLEDLSALTGGRVPASGRPYPAIREAAGRQAAESTYSMSDGLKRHLLQSAFADLLAILPLEQNYRSRRIASAHYAYVLRCAKTAERASSRVGPALNAFHVTARARGVELYDVELVEADDARLPRYHARLPALRAVARSSAEST